MVYLFISAVVNALLWLMATGVFIWAPAWGIPLAALAVLSLAAFSAANAEALEDDHPQIPKAVWWCLLPSVGAWSLPFGLAVTFGFSYFGVMTILGSAGAMIYGLWLLNWSRQENAKVARAAAPSEAPTRPHRRGDCIHDEDEVFSC